MAEQRADLGTQPSPIPIQATLSQPPARRRPADRRRDEILAVALELFGRHGEHAVSIEDVAACAGTSRNSVYRTFGSKTELFTDAMALLAAKLRAVQALPAPGAPSEQLELRLRRLFDVIEKYEAGYQALIHLDAPGAPAETREIILELRRSTYERVYEGLGIREPTPALRMTVRAWTSVLETTAVEWLRDRPVPRAEVESLLAVLLGVMLMGSASRDGVAGELLLRLLEVESPTGPFASHLARAGDLMSMKLFARIADLMHTNST